MDRRPPRRPFTVVDAMILIAAAAMGAFYTKILVDFKLVDLISTWWIIEAAQDAARWDFSLILQGCDGSLIARANDWSEPWLFAGTFAFVAIRLRKPRPSMRHLLRQSSFCALGIVVAIQIVRLLLVLPAAGIVMVQGPRPDGSSAELEAFLALRGIQPGLIIGSIWLAQSLNRRWRGEKGWIDRFGRVLGFCWIVSVLVFYLDSYCRVQRVPTVWAVPAPLSLPPPSSGTLPPAPVQPPAEPSNHDRTDPPEPGTSP